MASEPLFPRMNEADDEWSPRTLALCRLEILAKEPDDRKNLVFGVIQLVLSFSVASLARATFLVPYRIVRRKVKHGMSFCAV